MQKINFHRLLMPSVLDGTKTMTRRTIPQKALDEYENACAICRGCGGPMPDPTKFFLDFSRYKVGEVVAIAQSYKSLGLEDLKTFAGWSNKLYVSANLMPHQIRITGIKVERLQDISYESVLKEGIDFEAVWFGEVEYTFDEFYFDSALEAFRFMLSKCCKPKTLWEDNPWVFAYSYERVK